MKPCSGFRLRFLPHPLISITYLVTFTFFLVFGNPLFIDPDVPWHIAAGHLIRTSHSIPMFDPWSYTSGDQVWYNLSWLWDVLLSAVLDHFGESGLFVYCCIWQALFMSLLALSLMERPYVHEDALKVTLLLVGYVLMSLSPARPQMITYVLSALFALLLNRSRTDAHYKNLIWLPVIMLLWVNMHGGFIVGFSLLAVYAVEAYYVKNRPWLIRLIVTGTVCSAMTLINPYGWKIIIGVMRSLDTVVAPYIGEWHPFIFGKYFGITLFVLVFLLISNSANKKIPLADKLISFLWLIATLQSTRNGIIFALLAAPYMAMNMVDLMVVKAYADISGETYRRRFAGFAAFCTLLLCLSPVQRFLQVTPFTGQAVHLVPMDAISYVKTHYPNKRFWNDYIMGGYLIYYYVNVPEKRLVSSDSRASSVYSEASLSEMLKVYTMQPGWNEVLTKYHVDGVWVYNGSTFTQEYDQHYLDGLWKRVFQGSNSSVFVRP